MFYNIYVSLSLLSLGSGSPARMNLMKENIGRSKAHAKITRPFQRCVPRLHLTTEYKSCNHESNFYHLLMKADAVCL